MAYILCPTISKKLEPMWQEGQPYEKTNLYSIEPNKLPPVNYDAHTLKPHSLTHAEAESHVVKSGKYITDYFADPKYFFGECFVLRLTGDNYRLVDQQRNIFHWIITKDELIANLSRISEDHHQIKKLLITTDTYHVNPNGFHDPNYVLTLSQEAADYLTSLPNFHLYGTSWKSSDFNPGSADRPIHKTLFKKAIIFELLDLKIVPEGKYFFVGVPLPIAEASESPVSPILLSKNELQ